MSKDQNLFPGDAYKTLGVHRSGTAAELKAAWRALMVLHHPRQSHWQPRGRRPANAQDRRNQRRLRVAQDERQTPSLRHRSPKRRQNRRRDGPRAGQKPRGRSRGPGPTLTVTPRGTPAAEAAVSHGRTRACARLPTPRAGNGRAPPNIRRAGDGAPLRDSCATSSASSQQPGARCG